MIGDREQLWDRHEVAEAVGVSVASVNAWIRRHRVPRVAQVVEHGRVRNLYDPDVVREALRQAAGSGRHGAPRTASGRFQRRPPAPKPAVPPDP